MATATTTAYEQHTFPAAAPDEMGVLDDIGRDGWELIGVQDEGVVARRPTNEIEQTAWEYRRSTSLQRRALAEQMLCDGWRPCGRRSTYRYFKRRRATTR